MLTNALLAAYVVVFYSMAVVVKANGRRQSHHKFLSALALTLSAQLTVAATPSASGTTIPPATEIVDSHLDVWTVSGGQVYENGQLTPSAGSSLLYDSGVVYQENIHRDWWLWRNGVWVATSTPLVLPSTRGTDPIGIEPGGHGSRQLADVEQGLSRLSLLNALSFE